MGAIEVCEFSDHDKKVLNILLERVWHKMCDELKAAGYSPGRALGVMPAIGNCFLALTIEKWISALPTKIESVDDREGIGEAFDKVLTEIDETSESLEAQFNDYLKGVQYGK